MDSQLFFYINLAFVAFFLLYFISGRKNSGRTPTRLKLRNPDTEMALPKDTPNKPPSKYDEKAVQNMDDKIIQNAKKLNVLFLYNGHDWDAYEVLGVPAGANLPLVTERYQNLIKEADQGQIEFYEAAYQAILKKV